MDKNIKWLFLAGLLFALSACATESSAPDYADLPGFLSGLIHGLVILFAFIGSFFGDYVIYATPNSGWTYNLGYVIGILLFCGGGGGAASR